MGLVGSVVDQFGGKGALEGRTPTLEGGSVRRPAEERLGRSRPELYWAIRSGAVSLAASWILASMKVQKVGVFEAAIQNELGSKVPWRRFSRPVVSFG